MRGYVTLAVLANLVSMLRADIDGAIWLVDDDADGRFYEKCSHAKSRVVVSEGVALQLLATVKERGINGVIATISGGGLVQALDEDVFLPGRGDVASMLMASQSFERVLEEIAGLSWYKACEKEVGSLRDRAITLAWIFKGIQALGNRIATSQRMFWIDELIDWEGFRFSKSLLEEAFGDEAASNIESLVKAAYEISSENLLAECDGMDAIRVAAAATRLYRPRGLQPSQVVGPDDLVSMLRVTFDLEELVHDPMFWRMRKWERRNPRFPLLRLWRLLDPLQVLWDQRYWETDSKHMLETMAGNEELVAFKMDLDNFKEINEALGHSGGDEAIRLYCDLVRRLLGSVSEVYRRGGDEVVAFAPDLDSSEAMRLAEELRGCVESEFLQWGRERGLTRCPTASIGVVSVSAGTSFQELVNLMDEAQLRAKREGKNRVVAVPGTKGDSR